MRQLTLWQTYTREKVHDIFEPESNFKPQTGTWGLQGIVRLVESPSDFVFFVTYGTSQGEHDFDERISDDGVLTWQSQPQQRLDSPRIQQFIQHDDLTNSIHLFLRTSSAVGAYTYFGRLGYLEHDPTREQPVHFSWQLMDWPPPSAILSGLGIVPATSADLTSPINDLQNSLTETPPPVVGVGSGGGLGAPHATHPGQDAKNRKLGLAGEHLVLLHERRLLKDAGRTDLSDRVVHVALVEGDSAGYDVRSFNVDGSERHIEVKTTAGPASNAFFISPNEINFSAEHPLSYVLFRVYGYSVGSNSANFYEVKGPIAQSFGLTPSEYRARLLPS